MGKIVELQHPLVSHHLASLRDHATPPHLFREQIRRRDLESGGAQTRTQEAHAARKFEHL